MRHHPKVKNPQPGAARKAAAALDARAHLDAEALQLALRLLYGSDFDASRSVIDAFRRRPDERAVAPLVDTVFYVEPSTPQLCRTLRLAALDALAAQDPEDELVERALLAAARDPDPEVAMRAEAHLVHQRVVAPPRVPVRQAELFGVAGPELYHPCPRRRSWAGRALLAALEPRSVV